MSLRNQRSIDAKMSHSIRIRDEREKHSEQRAGEEFIGNFTRDSYLELCKNSIYKFRRGCIAYDIYGDRLDEINGLFPVFKINNL